MKLQLLTIPALAAATAFGLVACDSNTPSENAKQDQLEGEADVVRDKADQKADVIEDHADARDGQVEDNMNERADAVRDQGDARADRLEDQADAVGDNDADNRADSFGEMDDDVDGRTPNTLGN